MSQAIGAVTLLVRDYEEARSFYVDVLGFEVVEDKAMDAGKRWLVVAPPGSPGTRLLLARAVGPEQTARIGRQAGGRVFLFLHTEDFGQDHARMLARGVKFTEEPRHEAYGSVAVFEDLYGNLWDLLGPKP